MLNYDSTYEKTEYKMRENFGKAEKLEIFNANSAAAYK